MTETTQDGADVVDHVVANRSIAGDHLYLNGYRIGGGKPSSVMTPIGSWQVRRGDLLEAIPEIRDEITRLREENERLRTALNEIDALDPEGHSAGCSADALRGLVSRMGAIARNALKEPSNG